MIKPTKHEIVLKNNKKIIVKAQLYYISVFFNVFEFRVIDRDGDEDIVFRCRYSDVEYVRELSS
jgi:hypothetical protein|tara:strand:+ start:1555 stop:1746 length:192 start_codon:yes stop_codon:yes gene_type:complete